MARQATVNLTAGAWTELTNADTTTGITFQNLSNQDVWVMGTTGSAPTGAPAGALRYRGGEGERAQTLADLFPGVASADRLFAYTSANGVQVTVSHA